MEMPAAAAGVALNPPAASPVSVPENAAPVESVPDPDLSGWPQPWWRNEWYQALLFYAAILLVYSRALNGAFIWDDDKYISLNPSMRSLHGLWQIWFEPFSAGHQYYPLSFTGFWVGWQLWGMHTVGYHLVNVFLHATASVLLWQILKRLKVPGALLGAALFALHPVNVMSVAWMNEMKNTLSCTFALASIWAYLRFEGLGVYDRGDKLERPWGWYSVAIALFLLAMLSKTAVSFLPVSLLLILCWQRARIGWREIWPLLPMVGVVAGMGLLTIWVEHYASGATGKDFAI
jgi:protein O-mannosyl-transferase